MIDARAREAALWMAAAQVGFAAMNVAARAGAAELPWAEVGAARFLVGGLVALAIARARGAALRVPSEHRRASWVRSGLGTMAALCTFYAFGVRGLALGDAVTIMATAPLFVALFSWPVLGERVGARVVLAGVVSLVGVALVARPTLHVALDGGLAALGTAVFGGLAMLSLRRVGTRETSEAIVVHFAFVAAAALLLFAAPVLRVPDARGAAGLLATGVLGGLAQVAMTRAYALAPAAKVAALAYLSVVLTRLFAIPVFGERPTAGQLAGSSLVIAAGVVALAPSRPTRAP